MADQVDAFCAQHELDDAVAHAINLALDELVTNTINYGYDDDERHLIEIKAALQDGKVVVTLKDDARAFDPTESTDPDIDADLEERPVGGLGIYLARAMMDEIEYRHIDGRNQITLTKIVSGDAGTE